MSFKSALQDFEKVGLAPVRFHEKTAMERAKAILEEKLGNAIGTLKPPEDLDLVAARVVNRLENRQRLDVRDLHRAPWCIWHGRMRERETIVMRLLEEIAEAGQRRAFRMLAAAWLFHFKPGEFCISRVGGFLTRNAGHLGFPYAEAHTNYLLFDADSGPLRIADIALNKGQTPDQILFSAGIRGNAIGYREDVYRKRLCEASWRHRTREATERTRKMGLGR